MTAEELHQDFMDKVMRIIALKHPCGCMMLVHCDEGLIILANSADKIFQLGIIQAAMQTISVNFAMDQRASHESGQTKSNEAATMAIISEKSKGGVN